MNREDIDIMWNKALQQAIKEGEEFTRYHFAALVRADEREQGQKWFDAVTAQHRQLILAELQAFNKERQQYADWLDEAAADIEDWGMYASEYLQQKWDLPDQVQDYKNRAAAIRARGEAK
jgi:hypothetical protein